MKTPAEQNLQTKLNKAREILARVSAGGKVHPSKLIDKTTVTNQLPDEPTRPNTYLKAKALKLLSYREHSRVELRHKLVKALPQDKVTISHADIDVLLDELSTKNLLNERRFVQTLLNIRANRLGAKRMLQELKQHAIDAQNHPEVTEALTPKAQQRAALKVWQKRFGNPALDNKTRQKQQNFLLMRGFNAETVRQVLKQVSTVHNQDCLDDLLN